MKRKLGAVLLVVALALALGLVPAASVVASPGPGLVGLWHLDGNANDSSGTIPPNNGTLYGDATYATGMFDQALSLDGSGDYVEVLDADSLDLTGDFIFEAWINPTAINRYQGILQKGSFASTFGKYELHLTNDNKLRCILNSDTVNGMVTSSGSISVGVWTHVVATRSGNAVKLFINGLEDGNLTYGTPIGTDDQPLRIGMYYDSRFVFCGLIDEVRIWDQALTADQIALSANGSVTWLPPVTNADFVLKDGTTLPLKFQLFDDTGLVTTQQPVFLQVTGPDAFAITYQLGDGVGNLRWNADGSYYIANLKTKDDGWATGDYTATVIVSGVIINPVQYFYLSAEKGVGRGNSGK